MRAKGFIQWVYGCCFSVLMLASSSAGAASSDLTPQKALLHAVAEFNVEAV